MALNAVAGVVLFLGLALASTPADPAKAEDAERRLTRSPEFYQNFNPGSQSNSYSYGGSGSLLHPPIAHSLPYPGPVPRPYGLTTFNQAYGFGSHATNIGYSRRRKRSAQFYQNFQPGSISNSFDCGFGGCRIPPIIHHVGGHHTNVGTDFNQLYTGGSSAVNFGRRRRRRKRRSEAGGRRSKRSPQFYQAIAPGAQNNMITCVAQGTCLPGSPVVPIQQFPLRAQAPPPREGSSAAVVNAAPTHPAGSESEPAAAPAPAVSVHGTACGCSSFYYPTYQYYGVYSCSADADGQRVCRCICPTVSSYQYGGAPYHIYSSFPYAFGQPPVYPAAPFRTKRSSSPPDASPPSSVDATTRERREYEQTYTPGSGAVNINCGPNGCFGLGSLFGNAAGHHRPPYPHHRPPYPHHRPPYPHNRPPAGGLVGGLIAANPYHPAHHGIGFRGPADGSYNGHGGSGHHGDGGYGYGSSGYDEPPLQEPF